MSDSPSNLFPVYQRKQPEFKKIDFSIQTKTTVDGFEATVQLDTPYPSWLVSYGKTKAAATKNLKVLMSQRQKDRL